MAALEIPGVCSKKQLERKGTCVYKDFKEVLVLPEAVAVKCSTYAYSCVY